MRHILLLSLMSVIGCGDSLTSGIRGGAAGEGGGSGMSGSDGAGGEGGVGAAGGTGGAGGVGAASGNGGVGGLEGTGGVGGEPQPMEIWMPTPCWNGFLDNIDCWSRVAWTNGNYLLWTTEPTHVEPPDLVKRCGAIIVENWEQIDVVETCEDVPANEYTYFPESTRIVLPVGQYQPNGDGFWYTEVRLLWE